MATKRLLLGFNLPNTETDAHKSEYENAKKNIRNAWDLYKDIWELFQINSHWEKARKIL